MRQHSGALERKWNRQLTRPIFPAGVKNAVWGRDYSLSMQLSTKQSQRYIGISKKMHFDITSLQGRDDIKVKTRYTKPYPYSFSCYTCSTMKKMHAGRDGASFFIFTFISSLTLYAYFLACHTYILFLVIYRFKSMEDLHQIKSPAKLFAIPSYVVVR